MGFLAGFHPRVASGDFCEERNEDKRNHHCQGSHHGVAVSDFVDDDTCRVQTQNFITQSTVGKTSLPSGSQLIRGVALLPIESPYFSVNLGKA